MGSLLDWASLLVTFMSPIIVTLITVRNEKARKADAAIKKLEDEKQEKERKELNNSIQALRDDIHKVNLRINDMEKSIDDMQTFDQQADENLRNLCKSYQLASTYIHQIAQLVTVLAEGMRDQHLDGNVTQAITAYRTFEQSTLSNLMVGDPINK